MKQFTSFIPVLALDFLQSYRNGWSSVNYGWFSFMYIEMHDKHIEVIDWLSNTKRYLSTRNKRSKSFCYSKFAVTQGHDENVVFELDEKIKTLAWCRTFRSQSQNIACQTISLIRTQKCMKRFRSVRNCQTPPSNRACVICEWSFVMCYRQSRPK